MEFNATTLQKKREQAKERCKYGRKNASKVRDEEMGDNVAMLLDLLVDEYGRPFEPTDVQVPLLNDRTRFQAWLMGRRCGKSTTAAVRAIIELMKPYKRVWIVAPYYQLTEKIYRIVYSYVTRCLPFMLDGQAKNSKNEMSMRFVNGSELVCKSAEKEDQLIGESLDLVIVDEAGVVRDSAIRYLTPGLNDINPRTGIPKGKMIAVSTPRQFNWLKEWWDYGHMSASEQSDFFGEDAVSPFGGRLHSSHHATSYDNEHTDRHAIDADKKRLPLELWEQEYLAKWMMEGGLVFPTREEFFYPEYFRSVRPGQTTYMGIDIARARDYTVCFTVNKDLEQIGYMRLNKTHWSVIKSSIRQEIEKFASFGPVVVCMDETGVGSPIYEDTKAYFSMNGYVTVYPINFSRQQTTKRELIESLRMSIADGLLKFWEIKELKQELEEFAYTLDTKGNPIYAAPEGEDKHDDIVCAISLAHHATRIIAPTINIVKT